MSNIYIPEDLLKELLVRLPVESLIRFKRVSKSWHTLICSKEFARMHLNRSLMDPKACKVIVRTVYREDWRKIFKLLSADLDSPDDFLATLEEAYHPLQQFDEVPIEIIGSCHGLLCMRNCHYGLFLCNPCTKKHWKLPHFTPVRRDRVTDQHTCEYGFGYDDVNDDYKVVRLLKVFNGFEIYSLKSNSWRNLQKFHEFHVNIPFESPSSVLANCSLHWLCLDKVRDTFTYSSILAIDLRIDEYNLLPLPDVEMTVTRIAANLGVLDGCITLLSSSIMTTSSMIQIWVMKDYGIRDSWTRLINVHLSEAVKDPYSRSPLRFCQRSEEFIFQLHMKEVVWYNIRSKSVKKVKIPGSQRSPKEVFRFVCSLIDPDCLAKPKIGAK